MYKMFKFLVYPNHQTDGNKPMKYLLPLFFLFHSTILLAKDWDTFTLLPNQKRYEVPVKGNYTAKVLETETENSICYYTVIIYHDPTGFWNDHPKESSSTCSPKHTCKDLGEEHLKIENKLKGK